MGSQYAEWSQYTTYAVDAVVQYAGQIYVATAVNQNVIPYPPNATWNNISPVNPGILAGYVKNPMDTPLLCFNPSQNVQHSIDDAAYVSASEIRTDQISLLPGSLENAIKIEDSLEMRTAQEIRAEQELQLRTQGAFGYKFHNVQAGSHPYMLGYDPASGDVIHQPYSPGGGGTLTAVGAGTGITVDNTVPTVPVVANDGVLTVNSAKGALTVAAGSGISVGTVAGTITITNAAPSSGGTLTGVGAGAGVLVDNTVPAVPVVSNDGVLTVNSAKGALTVAAGTGIGVATVGSTITVSNTAPNFKPSFEYFVAKNGNDTTGDGSEENPYLTIQKAVQEAETVGGEAVVNIAAGTYGENIVIQTGYICLKGAIASPEAIIGTTISGLIGVSIVNGVSNLFGNQVILKGLTISGVVSDNTAAIEHTLVVEDCRIETGTGALDSNAVSALGTVADQRTFITNCRITQTSTATTVNPLVFCSTGRLLIDSCQLSVRTTSPTVGVSGTGVLTQLSQSLLESGNTTNILQPLVEISSSSTTPHNIALNSFTVASATAKLQSSAIGFNRLTPGVSVGVILNNFFSIAGTVPATAVITKNGSTTLFLEMAGNRAATGTSAGITAGTTISVPSLVGETTPDVVSNWANYPAVANVDMDGNDLSDAKDITATGDITTTNGNISSTSGDITTSSGNIETATGDITATTGVVSGDSLVAVSGITNNGTLETRDVGVVSIDGTAPATINMALTNTSVPPEVLTMAYNPFGNDKLEVNKGMILDGGLIMGAGGGVNNIENVLGLYSSDIVESKTLQAIDFTTIGEASITLKTTDPLFPGGTVVSMTYPDPTAQNTVLYAMGALSLDDPPNGGLPAQILINGVPQTLNGTDWSTYPATQALDMATFDIDNAGAITGTSVDAGSGTIDGGAITGTSLSAGSGTIGGGAITGTSLSAGSGAITGGSLTTTGIIKSSGTLQLNANTISNASNTTALTGVNSITMAGTAPSISGVNSLAITNTTAAVPFRITNSGDNPSIILEATTGSDIIPVEFTITNGAVISAIGNQRSAARGNFWFCNGADALQISNANRRMVANYSPSSPLFALGGATGAWVAGSGAFTSTVPKLIGTQTITLTTNNFPIPTNGGVSEFYVGIQGNVSYQLSSKVELATTVLMTRTRAGVPSAPLPLYGAIYNVEGTTSGFIQQCVNGISYNESVPANSLLFRIGDILTLQVYATWVGAVAPSISVAPPGISGVMSPVGF